VRRSAPAWWARIWTSVKHVPGPSSAQNERMRSTRSSRSARSAEACGWLSRHSDCKATQRIQVKSQASDGLERNVGWGLRTFCSSMVIGIQLY
jgi:hypothetical protein